MVGFSKMKLLRVQDTPAAPELLYQLLQERTPATNISHREMPTWDAHIRFIQSRPYKAWFIIQEDENPVGSIYLSKTNEIGVFEMKDGGLEEVANPSELFLAGRPEHSAGSVVVSTLEGSRPILVELQALVTSTGYAMPKRMANGVEINRVSLLLAVMEKRLGLHLSGQDVYLNVVGGLRIDEPAIDLGIVAAVVSSFRDQALDAQTLFLGEVGLGGEIRLVIQVDVRTREAMKLGFKRCVLPEGNLANWSGIPGLEVIGVDIIPLGNIDVVARGTTGIPVHRAPRPVRPIARSDGRGCCPGRPLCPDFFPCRC